MPEPTPAPTPAADAPVTLFYSYAHEDEILRDELQGHLKILERRGLLAPWHDRKIVPGQEWAGQIDEYLRNAELVLLLVSKDFIESDYIMGTELKAAMARHAANVSVVVPVMVRSVNVEPEDAADMPFLKLQGLPSDLKPVTSWSNRDEAWTNVAKGLRMTVKHIRERRSAPPEIAAPTIKNDAADVAHAGGAPRRPYAPVAPLSAAPARPDSILDGVIGAVVSQVCDANLERGQEPIDDAGLKVLRAGTLTLIDLPEQKRVLWVDDQPANNRREAAALAKLQIEVVAVRSTDEALVRLSNDREGFDLVISDWTRADELPMAGLLLLTRMRVSGHKQPLIYYHGTFDATRRALLAGAANAAGVFGEAVLPAELMALVLRALQPRTVENDAIA
jgi:CheY-like chemotaxis protein